MGRLVLFHHGPPRTDAQMDTIVAGLAGEAVPVTAARDRDVVDVGRPVRRGLRSG